MENGRLEDRSMRNGAAIASAIGTALCLTETSILSSSNACHTIDVQQIYITLVGRLLWNPHKSSAQRCMPADAT